MFKAAISGLLVTTLLAACARTSSSEITFWNDLPIMPDAVEMRAISNQYEYPACNYTIKADMDAVEEFYDEQMEIAGWELLGKGDTSAAGMDAIDLWFAKDKHTVSVQIFMKDDRTYVGLVLY